MIKNIHDYQHEIVFRRHIFLGGKFCNSMAQRVKNLPAVQETWVQFLSWEDGPEEGMATHSSILAWEIPWTEEPGGLYSPWGCKELDTTERLSLSLFTYNISLSLYVNLYLEFTSILAVSGGGIFFFIKIAWF